MTDAQNSHGQKRIKDKTFIAANGCWIWCGAVKKCKRGTHNYGWVTFMNKQMSAHRMSWIVFRSALVQGSVICHTCDNPRCVNPDHLFIGTQKDNVADMIAKGRKWIGVAKRKSDGLPVRSKLSVQQIQLIKSLRESGLSQQKIADQIGVSQGCVSQLLRGVTQYAK
jgi:predicted XRE-type DNA-binding protein